MGICDGVQVCLGKIVSVYVGAYLSFSAYIAWSA